MTPVICLIFTYLIKKIATDQLPNGSVYEDTTYPYVFNDFSLVDSNSQKVNSSTLQPIPGRPSRSNPLQWYLYECVDSCSKNNGLLGNYEGKVKQTNSDGKTIFGSIINEKSDQSFVAHIALDYYNNNTNVSNRYTPFFIPTQSLNS